MTKFEMLHVSDTSNRARRTGARSMTECALDWFGLNREIVEAIAGDLTEELAERSATHGVIPARLWYAREIVRSTPHIIAAVMRRGGAPARRLVALTSVVGLVLATAISAYQVLRVGAPARLVSDLADQADVILLNNTRPVQLPMRVLDEHGRVVKNQPVRYTRVSGAPIALSARGVVTCAQPGDAVVHATLGEIVTQLAIRCRPVKEIRASAWVDLVAGGDPSDLPFEAMGTDERRRETQYDGRFRAARSG